jgi:hypothetical protein
MVVRELFGQSSFEERIANKKKVIDKSVPIWGFDRTDISTEAKRKEIEIVLYSKGPILLSELENKVGGEKFKEICRQMILKKVTRTQQFLQILCEFESDEISNWVETYLKTR